jgi:hypothetical protein
VGIHEKMPLLIKHGTHGFYLEYKGEKRSLQSYEKIDSIESWISAQAVPPEEMDGLIAFLKTEKITEWLTYFIAKRCSIPN